MLLDFMNCANVRVVECGGSPCFSLESLEGGSTADQLFRKKFERDRATELDVLGPVNNAHTAAAKDIEHSIVRNRLAAQPRSRRAFRRFRQCRECIRLRSN